MRITTTGLAVLALGMLSAPAAAQMPTLTVRGGFAFPKGDYDQTTEGADMFARVGWTAGAEARFFVTDNLALFTSYDRLSNPVDEADFEDNLVGTLDGISVDSHVAHMTMGGLRMEGELVPDATLALHGGLGLAVFKPGDYAIRDGQAVAWDSDRHASLAGGLSITLHRVETMFRFYPFGTFENQGHVTNEDAESETATRSPVRVMTLTVGYTFF